MGDFFSRFEDFVFDFLGLIVPGIILLVVIYLPFYLKGYSLYLSTNDSNNSIIYLINNSLEFWQSVKSLEYYLAIAIVLSIGFFLGHFIKVGSILFYKVGTLIFDKFLIKQLKKLNRQLLFLSISSLRQTGLFKIAFWLSKIKKYRLIKLLKKDILESIFQFDAPNYFYDNKSLLKKSVSKLNAELKDEFPANWYSFFKFSETIRKQENLKNLTPTFLAKYNFYRSLSFIFFFSFWYIYWINNAIYSTEGVPIIDIRVLGYSFILIAWYVFHYKYKRYWTLCGNEALISAYYFLNRKK